MKKISSRTSSEECTVTTYSTTTTYQYDDQWMVDINSYSGGYIDGSKEAWLYRKDFGYQMHMLTTEPGISENAFYDVIEGIIGKYIELYKLLYEDEYIHVEKGFVRQNDQTITYAYYVDWMIDIVTIGRNREAYLYNRGCDVKMLMISRCEVALDRFLQILEPNIDSYIEQYKERYMSK